jgi:hypothetical protein
MNKNNKNNKYPNYGTWKDYDYNLNNSIITDDSIKNSLSHFQKDKLSKLSKDQNILTMFKVKYDTGTYRSISRLQKIKLREYKELTNIFIEYWSNKKEEYHLSPVLDIVYSYKILPLEEASPLSTSISTSTSTSTSTDTQSPEVQNRHLIYRNTQNFKFHGYNLPATMDFTQWGKIIHESDSLSFYIIDKKDSQALYLISVYDNYITVELKLKNKTLLSFTDTMLDKENLSTFKRTLKNQEYYFKDGELQLRKLKLETKFLLPILQSAFITKKFITMDLETRTINGKMSPYCVYSYDGKEYRSYYLLGYKDKESMLKASIEDLMQPKYDNYKIYFHNWSYFDGIFLFNTLTSLSDNQLKPKMRHGKLIDIKFEFKIKTNKKTMNLYFRDSLLLLPASLGSLTKNFEVENKGKYPLFFVNNPDIPLDYVGAVPNFKYFTEEGYTIEDYELKFRNKNPKYVKFRGITPEEYKEYCKSFEGKEWNLREESLKYCKQDVLALYQVLDKFNSKIFEKFNVDIHKTPTLSSLAFTIYRANFLKDSKIPLVTKEMYNDLKISYTGGAVDVYIPHGKNIKRYDYNSLYPTQMNNHLMPTGYPVFFEGDISLSDKNPFGFFEVEVTAPDNLDIPILQKRVKSNSCTRTIATLGKWTSWYFSEELYNAAKFGYRFNILRGYIFEKANIFKEFVEFLYNMKANSESGTPDYIIAKLLMNSLYGRLGMNQDMENHIVISNKDFSKIFGDREDSITNVIQLKNGQELVSFFDPILSDNEKTVNISVPVSSAITAYARIQMNTLKMRLIKLGIKLYYSDTDNVDVDQFLDPQLIGKELGKLKLEHIFEEATYLAPKVYGGLVKDKDGQIYDYTKIKGLKNPISYGELSSLLTKNNKLKIHHKKWYRDISKAEITIKDDIYTLITTDNKRKILYDENNKFYATKPFTLNNNNLE